MQKFRFPLLLLFMLLVQPITWGRQKNVTFRVVPQTLPPNSTIFLCGNVLKLGLWNPAAVALELQPDGSWTKTFSFDAGTDIEYKFTRGSWETEAVLSDGMEYRNFTLHVGNDTVVTLVVVQWRDRFRGETVLSVIRLRNKLGRIDLFDNWRYHAGDDTLWAGTGIDDSQWDSTFSPRLMPAGYPPEKWNGNGWFRLHLKVDSSLWNVPLGLQISQFGASEVYLDGVLLYKLGTVGSTKENETLYGDSYPRVLRFSPGEKHLLAFRYSNHRAEEFGVIGSPAGFLPFISQDLNNAIRVRTEYGESAVRFEEIFTVIPVTLALVHLLMFVFYPQAKENFYYAVCMIGWAAMAFVNFYLKVSTDAVQFIWLIKCSGIATSIAILFGTLTAYANVYRKFPPMAYIFSAAGIMVAIWSYLYPVGAVNDAFYAFGGLTAFETIRVFLFSAIRKDKGKWLIGVGFLILSTCLAYQILSQYNIVQPLGQFGVIYIYGVLALSITVSIDFSRGYAKTNKNLERQLLQVQELSEQALEQERIAKEIELSRRLLEAENERKSKELEEARQLQLSMSPKDVPGIPGLDLAVDMETATEVGGDYYDFHVSENGTLTIALGDATGHGTRAGTMVATVKGLFGAFGHDGLAIPVFFNRCSQIIREMHLGNLFMGMMMIKIDGHRLIASAAGMPPVFIYRNSCRTVDEILTKGMPLGSHCDFPYEQREAELASGDTILLMTDGFPESFNEREEIFDYPRVRESFCAVAGRSPEDIIAGLKRDAAAWRNGKPLNDDMTFIVIKVKK